VLSAALRGCHVVLLHPREWDQEQKRAYFRSFHAVSPKKERRRRLPQKLLLSHRLEDEQISLQGIYITAEWNSIRGHNEISVSEAELNEFPATADKSFQSLYNIRKYCSTSVSRRFTGRNSVIIGCELYIASVRHTY
jgi:hypothetical protein